MNFELIKNDSLSGQKAVIYSVRIEDEIETLLEKFVAENVTDYRDQVRELLLRLQQIGHNTGARETFFKPNEGKPGDGIEALYDAENKKLRLYCIRNGRVAVIVGGGGPKTTRTWQEDPKLKVANELLQLISKTIIQALSAGDLRWSADGLTLEGELTLDTDNY
ncbi:hypothetical protein [Spirosoma validum]|uniref:Uncharacterized protein n=1 Tax=Spirosoma validum TaxID=2771355 RepID=A0A927GGQ4_9BACT|nr:hypothetical protein [Spirosoma validum]MBD2757121.1 hypothetical protein [Spirosoma validum]